METAADAARREAAKQIVAFIFVILAAIVVMAVQDPDALKTWRMRLAAASGRLLSSTARRAGHISMGTELRTGMKEYSLPYALSKMRDKMTELYRKESGE